LHILSISVFVEFVCLLVQLLLVTCVSSLFHLTLAVTPTVTPPPLVFPSLSRGAVGQKKREKKEKKGKQSKKKEKKRENPKEKRDRRTVQVGNGNRFVSVQEFCAVTIRHRFVLVEGVFRGVWFRFWHDIPYLSCYSPR
jgi:flagellar biosynthesis component FlhA